MLTKVIADTKPAGALVRFAATVNGRPVEVFTTSERSLLDVLRDDLDLTGAKRCCDIGACGSCAVLLNGKVVMSCTEPIGRANGGTIETVEGLTKDGELHPLQKGFIEAHGFQCG